MPLSYLWYYDSGTDLALRVNIDVPPIGRGFVYEWDHVCVFGDERWIGVELGNE